MNNEMEKKITEFFSVESTTKGFFLKVNGKESVNMCARVRIARNCFVR